MKQVVVIGMGNFGLYLARELYAKGFEVVAIDNDPMKVQDVQDQVTQAVVADSTDIATLQSIGVEQADLVVICIGTNLSASILTTLNVKDLGVEKVYAKALSESHGRVLEKLGAEEVFYPERDLAKVAARKIANPNMIDYIPFIEDYTIAELAPPQAFMGKTLKEVNLINKYGIQVMAIKDVITGKLNIIPTGEHVIKDSDILILLGKQESIDLIREK